MTESSFWDQKWKSADREKLPLYFAQFDRSADMILRFLRQKGYTNICDAGCGCGAFSLKLALHGFSVSGFDISENAVALAKSLLSERGYPTQDFRAADVLSTGYPDGQFDAAVSRDVIDHMPIRDGVAAVKELLRIVKSGGCVLLTLDKTDGEYESEPHTVNNDGDYCFTGGKWNGMVFHPYSRDEIARLGSACQARLLANNESGLTLVFEKE